MAEHAINLTAAREAARIEMNIDNLEIYFNTICDNHIRQKLDEQLAAKTIAEKQALLNS